MKSTLDHALDHIKRGLRVFPLAPNSKVPDISKFTEFATDNPQIASNWFANKKTAPNIGVITDNLVVIDVDPRKGGMHSFAEFFKEQELLGNEFPKTARSKTQSGGAHIFYKAPPGIRIKGGTDKLGPGLDIKARGGYVVAAGSSIDGRAYTWENTRPILDAPQWLLAILEQAKARTPASGTRIAAEDDDAVTLAESYIFNQAPEAFEGDRDNTAFRVAARLYDFGCAHATAESLLSDWNATKCFPPLEPEAIARLARSAETNRDKPIGADHPTITADGFEPVEIDETKKPTQDQQDATKSVPPKSGLFYVGLRDGAARAFTHGGEPLIDGLLDCGAMSVIYGESNSGKTFVTLDQDYHIAAGLSWAHRDVKKGAVVYVAAEGGRGIYKRLQALTEHYKPEGEPLLFTIPCPVDLRNPKADIKPLVELIRKIEADCGEKVVKVTIDTLSRAMAGGDENSPVDMGLLVHHFDAIRAAVKCHLTVIHHTGKDAAKGARGHSLLRAATDTEIEIAAGGRLTVTKQRDLEGDVEMVFALRPKRLGQDDRGKEVSSCIVELRKKGDAPTMILPLDAETELFADQLEDDLIARQSRSGTATTSALNQHFTTSFANECASRVVWANGRYLTEKPDAMRNHVRRVMGEMVTKGWIEKSKRGQWVWRNGQNGQNGQA